MLCSHNLLPSVNAVELCLVTALSKKKFFPVFITVLSYSLQICS